MPTSRQRPGYCSTALAPRLCSTTRHTSEKRVLGLAITQPDLKWVVIDGSTINTIDSTGAETLEVLARDLARQGVRLGLAAFRTAAQDMLERSGALATIGNDSVYPTLKSAMNAFLAVRSGPLEGPQAGEAAANAQANEGPTE